jgi:HEAT repeat protein
MGKSIEELIESLNNDDEFIREESSMLLESKGKEAVEHLIKSLLNNRNKNAKIAIAKVLGFIGDERAIDPLISTLKDPNKLVRREASTALSKMGNIAVDPLISILSDEDWKVRGAAAWALGSIGNKMAIDPLNKLLDDENGFVKSGAKWALDKINKLE